MVCSKYFRFFLCASLYALALPAGAQSTLPKPNWDRELALKTAAMGANEQQRRDWLAELRQGKQDAVLQSIREFSESRELSSPAREQQLFLFTIALADFPAEQVPARILEFLAAYAPQTLVAHEESVSSAVPLFNIPSAARGVQHAVARQRGESRAAALLAGSTGMWPDTRDGTWADIWIRDFLAASAPAQAGFLDALAFVTAQQINELDQASRGLLGDQPALTSVAARTALAGVDVESMRRVMEYGGGPEVASMLRTAAATLAPGDRAQLLLAAMESAPPQHAALAIALLSPGLEGIPQVILTLFDLLEDPELGSAAALSLSRLDSPDIRQQLRLLGESAGIAAARARLAISLSETQPVQGATP